MVSGTACESYHKRSASPKSVRGTASRRLVHGDPAAAGTPPARASDPPGEDDPDRARDDLEVEHGRPVDEVLQVVAQLVLRVGVVAPVDLGQAGQPGGTSCRRV